ncbi:glycoside hydrolase family 30 protein [Stackebrandtia nassauensis]|uniref:Glucan endo-1,6-beta-glucosidase n=1 Tax=Stackebrandtia nassauensis (strain DSM 44728 / CIP 108903 / NRRL B-16338 / NBRC 102104 / LLR-40K-21) TaxID=446470 RepID=D3PUL4_STANL|nr:glycoside hydrolase family 30 beta sandwich domain-containing protein [Stackebrandtia nassauensis]ADD43027.1 Glucan endo-1,6-beta-glucosidase [Stackebrandtia nassauensis DSM 44728]
MALSKNPAAWLTVLIALVLVPLVPSSAQATWPRTTVSSWITTPDRARLLDPGPSPVFRRHGSSNQTTITVDERQRFQSIDGFGASLTDSSASLLYSLSESQRDDVMASLFDRTDGIGMSFLRQPIGSSDFVDGPHYTYNDLPDGETDFDMSRFSIAHDEVRILPLLRQARALNPSLKVMATPWGQPAWMKENNSTIGGRLKDDPDIFAAYALYLLRFVEAYEDAGVPIYALTVQNEPQHGDPDGYPGTDMPVEHQAAIIEKLGPMLDDAGYGHVKILSFDHNWALHPDDPGGNPRYPYDVLKSQAVTWIDGTAYHCYAGSPDAQTALHDSFPDKDIWFTECSGWHGNDDSPAKYFSDTLRWHAQNVTIGTTRNWARAAINWNLALNSQGGPANGGCGNSTTGKCTGVVHIDGTTVTRNAEYYNLGHMTKYVRPGAVRIGSDNAGDIHNVAFKNPGGTIVLVATNIGGSTQTFTVSWSGRSIEYTLDSGAVATLTWRA